MSREEEAVAFYSSEPLFSKGSGGKDDHRILPKLSFKVS